MYNVDNLCIKKFDYSNIFLQFKEYQNICKMRYFKYYTALFLIILSNQGPVRGYGGGILFSGGDDAFESVKTNTNTSIKILSPYEDDKFKRGQMIEIRWKGGIPGYEYSLDLYKGKFHYRHIDDLNDPGIYPWIIPMDVEPSEEYRFKMTNTKDFSEYSFGETFTIKRKVPVLAWIIPGGIVITGAAILLLRNDSSDINNLPDPIEPK
jgi:hypothetical protein